jgi:GNAT superfamily N-acetyltransferase
VSGPLDVHDIDPVADRDWVTELLESEFSGPVHARGGETLDARDLPGLVAEAGGRPAGLLFYRIERDEAGDDCELFLFFVLEPGNGVGTALLDALVARAKGCRRIWLVTTNDNLRALRFYQRRGFALRALHPGAVDDARGRLKPGIPLTGDHGIPLRDELELERPLDATAP